MRSGSSSAAPTPTSQLSLVSGPEADGEPHKALETPGGGTRRSSSSSSGIGTSQGGDSGAEAASGGGSLSGLRGRLDFTPLPILAPIRSRAAPDQALSADGACEDLDTEPQAFTGAGSLTAAVSMPNPANWNADSAGSCAEQRQGLVAPTPDSKPSGPEARRKRRKRRPPLDLQRESEQQVPLRTISTGRIRPGRPLPPIPDASGESRA